MQKPKVFIQEIIEDENDYDLSGDKLKDSSRTKKQKEEKIKKMLLEIIQFYESMARTFYDAKVQRDSDVTLPTSEEDSVVFSCAFHVYLFIPSTI